MSVQRTSLKKCRFDIFCRIWLFPHFNTQYSNIPLSHNSMRLTQKMNAKTDVILMCCRNSDTLNLIRFITRGQDRVFLQGLTAAKAKAAPHQQIGARDCFKSLVRHAFSVSLSLRVIVSAIFPAFANDIKDFCRFADPR